MLISVIVPVYNIEEYVGKCLESICQQSYSDLELIVVDDGSTDDSGKICDNFAVKDSRVRVFHKKNEGLSQARNYGISKAQGEYIALVDGDDFVKKNFIKEMINTVEKTNAEVVICGYDEILPEAKVVTGRAAAIKLLVEQENLEIVAWNKLYKREIFKDILYPVNEKYEDSLTTYKILAKATTVSYINKSLYCYVKREGSIMNEAKLIERLDARLRAATEAKEYFKKDKDLKQAAEIAILTAKYAFVDAAIKKKIDKKYYFSNLEWIKKHKVEYKNNNLMTKKLKIYNFLNDLRLYKLFRTII